MKKDIYVCSHCGREYEENYMVVNYRKNKMEDFYYMICPTDRAIAYKKEEESGEEPIVGKAIVGKAKVGKAE